MSRGSLKVCPFTADNKKTPLGETLHLTAMVGLMLKVAGRSQRNQGKKT